MKLEDYPDTIYKYRSWENDLHKNILLKGEVYMSAPKDFNDPFDCRITTNHYLIDTPEKKKEYVDKGIEKYLEWLKENKRDIEFERKQHLERLQDIETYQREHEKLESSQWDKYMGILSLSGRWDSILMWSHYGDFHKGFCIGFNEEKLRTSGLFGKGGRVRYSEDFPVINPLVEQNIMEKSFYQTHSKAMDWQYEEEYRLTKLYFPNTPTTNDRVISIPVEFIEEVNLGMKISEKSKKEIVEICRERNIKVYQTTKIPFKFQLTRELV